MLNLPQKTFLKLSKASRFALKNKLLRQRRQLEKELKEVEKEDPLKGDSIAGSTETGTDSWLAEMHGKAVAITRNVKLRLDSTKEALMAIRLGKYGKCKNCGKQIEKDRLEALPTATLCLSCSKKK